MEASSTCHILKTLLSLSIFTSYIINSTSAAGQKTNTEFIRTSCSTTSYPRLCFTSLSSHASAIQTSPKLLAHTALSLTLYNTQWTSATMFKLAKTHNLKPREVGAMRDCVEEMGESVDLLRKSLGEMRQIKGSNFELMMNDIQTWVSAALTDDDTCSDGFAGNGMNGNMKNIVRGRIVNIARLTSNALALINNYDISVHG